MKSIFLDKRKLICGIIFACPVAFFHGYSILLRNHVDSDSLQYLMCAINMLTIFIGVLLLYFLIDTVAIKMRSTSVVHDLRKDSLRFLIITLLQVIAWGIVFLAYYPGLFTYDVNWQIPFRLGTYTTHHPLIHTLYLQFFYYVVGEKLFGSVNVGVACATVLQMIFFAMMVAYVHLFLARCGVRRWIRYVLIAFTCLCPYYSLLSISLTKDTFWSGFVAMLIVCLGYRQLRTDIWQKRSTQIVYLASIIGVITLRNNGKYIIAVLAIVWAVVSFRRKEYKELIYTLCGIMAGLLLMSGLKVCLHAEGGSSNEFLSVPYQQIARVYNDNNGALTESELEDIVRYIPAVENYRARLADKTKNSGTGNQDFAGFIALWVKLGVRFPVSYVKAFVQLNDGYLDVTDMTFADVYGPDEIYGIFMTKNKALFDVNLDSKIWSLYNLYERLYTYNDYQEIWLLKLFLSPALYFWMILLVMMQSIQHRRGDMLLALVFIVALMGTLLLGPCVLTRYALPYIMCVPVTLVMYLRKI